MTEEPQVTYKEKIWKELSKLPEGEIIQLALLAQKIGCSLAHLSITCRVAKEAGFLVFHENGDYAIKKIPEDFITFDNATREKSREYRARVKGTGTPRGTTAYRGAPGFARLPANAQIDLSEENILSVLGNILKEHTELKNKYEESEEMNKKLKKFIIKMKKERAGKNPFRN